MSITDELREWINGNTTIHVTELRAIADRIDAEHEKATSGCIHYDPERHYCSVHGDTEHGWVKLPIDADGVPIRVGDVLTDGEYTFTVFELSTFGDGSWSIRNENGNAWAACDVTHHHEPTVEDVVADVADKAANLTGSYHEGGMNGDEYMDSMRALVAEYAAKLRLAEEVDA